MILKYSCFRCSWLKPRLTMGSTEYIKEKLHYVEIKVVCFRCNKPTILIIELEEYKKLKGG